jgi:hypothetical protein
MQTTRWSLFGVHSDESIFYKKASKNEIETSRSELIRELDFVPKLQLIELKEGELEIRYSDESCLEYAR